MVVPAVVTAVPSSVATVRPLSFAVSAPVPVSTLPVAVPGALSSVTELVSGAATSRVRDRHAQRVRTKSCRWRP